MSLPALTITEHAPVKRAALMAPIALLDALVAAREYGVVDDEDAKNRADDLTRMMGQYIVKHLQRLAVTEARERIAAATKSEASGSVWAKHEWDSADGAVRALVELGLTDTQIIKEVTS